MLHITDAQTRKVLVCTDPDIIGADEPRNEYVTGALQSGDAYTGDIELGYRSRKPSFYACHVIKYENAEPAAVLVLEVLADDIIGPMLHTGEGLGESGEALLVNQDAVILTSLKHDLPNGSRAVPLEYRIKAKPALLVAKGQEGIIESEDYRGEPVLAAYRHFEGLGWGMVVKRDKAELFAPIRQSAAYSWSIALGGVVAVLLLTVFVSRKVTRPILSLSDAAERVSNGDLNARAKAHTSDEVGRLTRAFGVMVAQVKQMLRRVEESRQMAAVGKFASQISHEIRNPLTSLKMNLQALRRGVESGELTLYATPVEIALREVERLEAVVRGVLSLGRRRETKREPFALHQVLRDSLEACAGESEERGIRVELECGGGPDRILGDSLELEGAIVNLLRNAGEAMSDGGTVRMWTETVAGGADGLPSSVRIHVVDQGPGIPPDLREKIFDPFVSTKEGGTGFGLALALQAVEGHGGSIVLTESAPGEGAHFLVELPLAMAVEAAASGDGGIRAEREEPA